MKISLHRSLLAAGTLAAAALLLAPGVPAWAAFNFPTVFGPFTGDCSTPNSTSTAITCSKSNGNSFASMAFQAAGGVVITGGAIDGTTVGAVVKAAIGGTTGVFTGLLTGAANTFTGLSTQIGGHVIGTADLVGTATLTAAQEDVCVNATAAATITLAGANGLHQVVTDCTGTAATAAVTVAAPSGSKLLGPSGLVQSITYTQNFQSATYVCHSNNNVCVVE